MHSKNQVEEVIDKEAQVLIQRGESTTLPQSKNQRGRCWSLAKGKINWLSLRLGESNSKSVSLAP